MAPNSPMNLSSLSPKLLIDHHHHHHHDQQPSHLQVSSSSSNYSSSSSSSSSSSLHSFINPLQLQADDQSRSHDHDHDLHPPILLSDGLTNSSLWINSENTINKRLPAKIRLTGRMMNTTSWSTTPQAQAQKHNPNTKKLIEHAAGNPNTTTPVRVCSDCNTTKTPLWRSGPRGPKTLCNACGIRQRKARRAMAAAAAGGGGGAGNGSSPVLVKINITKVQNKMEKKRSSNNIGQDQYLLPYNKRFRDHHIINDDIINGIRKGLCFEDFFTKKLAFHRVFPKDEEEAAILLMALSSGLLHG